MATSCIKPDLATLRRTPWLAGTALVLCDILDHHHPRRRAAFARAPCSSGRSPGSRTRLRPMWPRSSSSTCSTTATRAARRRATATSRPPAHYIEDYHIFQTTKGEGVMRAIRNGLDAAGMPVEKTKGEWGPGQEEINVLYAEALEMADRHVDRQERRQGDRLGSGKAVTFMAKWRLGPGRSSSATSTSRSGTPTGKRRSSSTPRRAARHVAADAPFLAGQLDYAGDMTYFLAPYINSYKRFRPARSRRPRWSGAATTAPPASGCAARAQGDPRRVPHRRRRPQPLPRLRRPDRRRPARHRGEAGARARVLGRRLRPARCPRCPRRCATRPRRSTARRCCARRSATTWSTTTSMPRDWEQFEYDRRVTDWELMRGFERH